ncbi:unnamed protein product [Paramecium sonneborni]|uniref:Reverse transcriptase domain-containing protein n=1 Tax=Paramecium sonneborni TaxID=65129 RepID=A0A8S1QKS7_9CILI|nr:unnamed protein product [Paramecium sonneborni]
MLLKDKTTKEGFDFDKKQQNQINPSTNSTNTEIQLTFLSWNVSSLKQESFKIIDQASPYIICLQEVRNTKINDSIKYKYYHKQVGQKHSGGIITGINKEFNSQDITDYYINHHDYDILIIRATNQLLDLIIINVYLNNNVTYNRYKVALTNIILKILSEIKQNQLMIVCGDFNSKKNPISILKQLNENTMTFRRKILDKIRISQTDHILINKSIPFSIQSKWTNLSDHVLLIIQLIISQENNCRKEILEINKKLAQQECQKLYHQNDNFSSFYKQYQKSINKHHIINKRRIKLRKLQYKLHEQELVDQFNNTFKGDKRDFFKLIKKTILLNLNKREGGIYNCYLDDTNNIIVGEDVFKNCYIQLDNLSKQVKYFPLAIPQLNQLSKDQVEKLRIKLASDKAISYDCITHQFIKNCNWKILSDLWKEDTFLINKLLGWARLVPLNKVYPNIPNKTQFRPIVILSPLYKFIEMRFYDKLMNYLQEKILKEQTGFVKGFGTQVNILAICDIFKKTKAAQKLIMLFIDFSSAYNTVNREKLYQLLENNNVLEQNEVKFLKAIHSRIIYINPYNKKEQYYYENGVIQGSPISPQLFDIYMDGFLRQLKSAIKFSYQFLGYADDLVFIVKQSKLQQFIFQLRIQAKEWAFILNEKKSGILPIKWKMVEDSYDNFPVVNNYKYLGIKIDNKGQIKQHIDDIEKIVQFKMSKLKYVSFKMDFRQRLLLFLIYIQPYFNYCQIIEQFQNKSIRKRFLMLRKRAFKNLLRLPQNTNNFLMDSILSVYNIKQSSNINKTIRKLQERLIDVSQQTLIHLYEKTNQLQRDIQDIRKIYLIPKNLQYVYKLAWTFCKSHNNSRLTAKHVILEHLNFQSEEEFYTSIRENLNENIQNKIEQDLYKVIDEHIKKKDFNEMKNFQN